MQETQGDRVEDVLPQRRQYDRQIGDFQALSGQLADMFVEVEQARSMVMRGLAALVDNDVLDRAIVAAAKARVAQVASWWASRPSIGMVAPA